MGQRKSFYLRFVDAQRIKRSNEATDDSLAIIETFRGIIPFALNVIGLFILPST